jgi:hypothetical protein
VTDLWSSDRRSAWEEAADSYAAVVAAQQVAGLEELDSWYRSELPTLFAERDEPFLTLDELVRITRWKMARGVWRARNLALVKGNDPDVVVATTRSALSQVPDPRKPIAELSRLAGVGPATASAVAAALAPESYPFFDELVAAQVPGLGEVAFTPGYYSRYAEAIRTRARQLGTGWTPARVERALWSKAGGKSGRPHIPPA